MCTSETGCACATTPEAPAGETDGLRTVYQVAGMTCGGCASRVSTELAGIPGVRDVSIDVTTGTATVTSGTELDHDIVSAAVTQAGYRLVP